MSNFNLHQYHKSDKIPDPWVSGELHHSKPMEQIEPFDKSDSNTAGETNSKDSHKAKAATIELFDGMYDDNPHGFGHDKHKDKPEHKHELAVDENKEKRPARDADRDKKKKIRQINKEIKQIHKLDKEADKLEANGKIDEAKQKRQDSTRLKDDAIGKAIEAYHIDISKTKSVKYNSSTMGEGETSSEGAVSIGDAAFHSAGWLGSTVGHEAEVHVNEQLKKGNWYTGAMGTSIQEVQTYQYELDNVRRFGTTRRNRRDLRNRRNDNFNQLTPEYQERAKHGNYTMKPGDENL